MYAFAMCKNHAHAIDITPANLSEVIGQCSSHITRKGKDMAGYYAEEPEPEKMIYEVSELETSGHLKLAITAMRPGKVGNEFHMTKGHFHEDGDAGEVYYCLKGEGLILLQTTDGQTDEVELKAGGVAYIPPGWAHRSVNTGKADFIFLAIYPSTAGHDYADIEKEGFKKRVMEKDGIPTLLMSE